MSFRETPLFRLDDLVADDEGGRVIGAHLVVEHVLDGVVDLLASEHPVVERRGHGLADQLEDVEVGHLGCVKKSSAFNLKIFIIVETNGKK